ncbi:MAG: cupin [Acidiferrobacteraceae bacterium]|nr:cupin [Acidiferrobacteraceae bacterium]|tara:strand:- start:1224 stop:1592 length:369 start_codon:yes stop_codon:yes gene_type:complete
MASLEKKSFDNPDEAKTPDKTHAATVNFGSVAASRIRVEPGWSWSSCIKPHVGGNSCQAGHVGMVLKGSVRVRHDDGTELVIEAGDAYSLAPGHDAWVEGDEAAELYEFNNSGKTYAVWQEG